MSIDRIGEQRDIHHGGVSVSASVQPGCLTIPDFCRWSGIGRTTVYALIKDGSLAARKCGKRTLISYDDAVRWRDGLAALK